MENFDNSEEPKNKDGFYLVNGLFLILIGILAIIPIFLDPTVFIRFCQWIMCLGGCASVVAGIAIVGFIIYLKSKR